MNMSTEEARDAARKFLHNLGKEIKENREKQNQTNYSRNNKTLDTDEKRLNLRPRL